MKLSKYLVGTLACTLFAACSNEENPAVDNGAQGQEGSSYMAVNLVFSTGSGSRAVTDEGFDNGTDAEGAVSVNNSVFLFYDANGNYLTKGNLVSSDTDVDKNNDGYLDLTPQADGGNVESKSNAVIVLGPTTSQPTQMLAVLNGGSSALAGMSLSAAMEAVTSNGIGSAKGNFIMTNSAYISSSNIVTATDITGKTKEVGDDGVDAAITAAKNDPAEIYVERVAAKITVTSQVAETGKELSGDGYIVDNTTGTAMRVVIDGWCENAYNASSYYIKNLNESWIGTAPFTDWTGDHRTYWAQDANYTGSNTYPDGATYAGLQYHSWSDATNKSGTSVYVHENTIDNTFVNVEGDDNANVTTVLVAAHIDYKKADDENWTTNANIYKQNGVYYTEDVLKQNIVASGDYYWYYTADERAHHVALDADDVTMTFTEPDDATPGSVTVTVSDITVPSTISANNPVLVKGDNSTTSVEETTVIAALNASAYTQNLVGYKKGACYYQIPIEHLGGTTGNEFYGVVRNHSYQLTITDITDIGGPIYNPDKDLPLIPGEDKNYYMAARLNVLAWKVISQSAVLN